jgi:hypothetical protein
LNAEDLPRDHMSYVTASGTINHIGLSALYRIVGHECRFVDLVLRRAYDIASRSSAASQQLTTDGVVTNVTVNHPDNLENLYPTSQ